MLLVNVIVTHVRSLLARIRSAVFNFNLFDDSAPRSPIVIFRERLLTRLFFLFLILSSIAAGFYTFLAIRTQLITVQHPSFAIYQQLYNDHADTLHCPCSQQSISYGSFLNVTFDLHQVCFSDLVSSSWLNYLESFDPTLLPSWTARLGIRDFRTTGNSYFQLLATFCSLAKSNIADAQNSFRSIQLVSDRVLTFSLFSQQTNAITESYIKSTQNDFQRILAWIIFTFTSSYFVTGTNTNSDIVVSNNGTVAIQKLNGAIVGRINHTYVNLRGPCACPVEYYACTAVNLLFTNGTSIFQYERRFSEIPINCMPLSGLLTSKFDWWYSPSHLNDIEDTYSQVILSQPSQNINALDASRSTQYQNQTLQYLLNQMFIEPPIHHEALFSRYYEQCAPTTCSYTVIKRRDFLVFLFLLISICGGLNRILRILVHGFGKLVYFLIDWRQNRESDHCKSYNCSIYHFFYIIMFLWKQDTKYTASDRNPLYT